MNDQRKKTLVLTAAWIGFILCAAILYKLVIKPALALAAAEDAKAMKEHFLRSTSGESYYKGSISISMDAFAGYFPLRSETFARELAAEGIKMSILNEPDQGERLASIARGDCQFAAFTAEGLIRNSSENSLPATIIACIDSRSQATDVLAVSREFLSRDKESTKKILKCYFRALYAVREKFPEALAEDGAQGGDANEPGKIEATIKEVKWDSLMDNYARFGIRKNFRVNNIEDVIDGTSRRLILSREMAKDPTNGDPQLLYYGQILKELEAEGFHPGDTSKSEAKQLTDAQWNSLVGVKKFETPAIGFSRGSHSLSKDGKAALDQLAENLASLNSIYVTIRGDASKVGDPEANKALSLKRAEVAADYLKNNGGIPTNRIRAIGGESTGSPTARFILGQEPY